MKQTIQGIINKMGYSVTRIRKRSNLQLYTEYDQDSLQNRRFYNIGAGDFSHPYWTNIDFDSDWYSCNRKHTTANGNIQHDLMSLKPLPIESNSAEIVYTSHTVEHLTDEADKVIFNEAHRILKPNGIFRMTTYNIDLAYRAYQNNDKLFFPTYIYVPPEKYHERHIKYSLDKASAAQLFIIDFATQLSDIVTEGCKERITDAEVKRIFAEMPYAKALDYCTAKCTIELQQKYPGWHINWWNQDKAIKMLTEAGFSKVYVSAHRQSVSPVLREGSFFDNTFPEVSFYVEAIK